MRPNKKQFGDVNNNFADVFDENDFYVSIFFWWKKNLNLKDSHEKEFTLL